MTVIGQMWNAVDQSLAMEKLEGLPAMSLATLCWRHEDSQNALQTRENSRLPLTIELSYHTNFLKHLSLFQLIDIYMHP